MAGIAALYFAYGPSRDLEAASAFDAVQLFTEAVIDITEAVIDITEAVIDITEAVAGMPLAIKLAAGACGCAAGDQKGPASLSGPLSSELTAPAATRGCGLRSAGGWTSAP